CGLTQSILISLPLTVTGLDASYSAANEWCARIGKTVTASAAKPTSVSLSLIKEPPAFLYFTGNPRFYERALALLARSGSQFRDHHFAAVTGKVDRHDPFDIEMQPLDVGEKIRVIGVDVLRRRRIGRAHVEFIAFEQHLLLRQVHDEHSL